ncbi:MAG: tetratricopeptide repeat protein [Calditrichaeota bacterium]|nr:tetratricopeptide repeat protein [Calditrichota bacterium]
MKIPFFLVIVIAIGLFFSCQSDVGTEPSNYSPEKLTADGWTQFENGEYTLALNNFKEAIRASDTYVDAYNGAGWTNARQQNLSDAASYFSQCLNLDANYNDALAGNSFLAHARKDYQTAVQDGNKVVANDPNWDFSHDANIDIVDVYLVLAESYFALQDFTNSLLQVQKIDPTFSVDVSTYEGKAKLADKIEALRNG